MHKHVYKCPNHTANLNNMRLNNRWCDLTIKVDGQEFRAHKTVLAANLQYFDSMLSGDSFRESKGEITMQDVNATDVEAFITYAYTGEISLTDDNALSLLETANYLGEEGIKKACTEFLENHLKTEESFWAYNFAKSIDCLSLKNAAKSRILLNFENISQSNEYLDLDFESLTDVLSYGQEHPVESQQIVFEGIMRWILHDAIKRRFRIHDLLSFIGVSKLPADYLMKYFGSMANHNNDNFEIVIKDLMTWYHNRTESQDIQIITKHQVEHSEQTLMILDANEHKICWKFYNFVKSNSCTNQENVICLGHNLAVNLGNHLIRLTKVLIFLEEWSQLQVIQPQFNLRSRGVVLNDKFYFMCGKSEPYCLHIFDPSTKLVTNSSKSVNEYAAMCACSRFIYICGGQYQGGSKTNNVLRYDPQTNSIERLPSMRTRRTHAAAVFYRGCLYVIGGLGDQVNFNKVEKYDPDTKEWMELPSMCDPHAKHAVAVLDGKLYACGGEGFSSVEIYDPAKNSWQLVANMKKTRYNFTLVAYKGKLLAIGGDEKKSVEVYDPSKDQWHVDHEMSSGLQMKWTMGGFISSSCIADA